MRADRSLLACTEPESAYLRFFGVLIGLCLGFRDETSRIGFGQGLRRRPRPIAAEGLESGPYVR